MKNPSQDSASVKFLGVNGSIFEGEKREGGSYLRTKAPPALVFLQSLQCQIPTAALFTENYSNPQEGKIPEEKEMHLKKNGFLGFSNETYLSTELTEILGMLTDFDLLDLLPKTGTITGTYSTGK